VRAATLGAGAFVAIQVAGKATRDALFLSHYPAAHLPMAMMASSGASLLAVLAFSRALAVRAPARVVPLASALAAALLVAEWALALASPRAAAAAVYLHLAFFGATLVSGFWSVVNERFDPYSARRVVGRIGLGAAVGGVVGGAAATVLSGLLPVHALLLVCALFNAVGVYAVLELRTGIAPGASPGGAEAPGSGLVVLRKVPYLRDLAAIVALGAVASSLLDYVLGSTAAQTYARGAPLLGFFAMYQTVVAVGSLALQVTLARPLLRAWGLAGTLATQPLAVFVAGLVALLDPRLWAVALVRGAEAAIHNSLYRSGYELLYTPLPTSDKRPAKALVDVGFDKVGALLGSGLALAVVSLWPGIASRAALAVAVIACGLVLVVCRRVHAGYVDALEASLRSGAVQIEPAEVEDSTTRLAVLKTTTGMEREALRREIEALRSQTVARRADPSDPWAADMAALRGARGDEVRAVLRRHPDPDPAAVALLVPLLSRNDLFLDVLRALRRVSTKVTGQLVDAMLDPELDPAVRRRLPRVLKACPTPRAAQGLLAALSDPRFDVRVAATQSLARMCEQHPSLAPAREVVFVHAARELATRAGDGARQASETVPVDHGLDRHLDHVFTLLSLALDREALQLSLLALRGGDARLRGTALEWLDNVLPDGLRAALWPHVKVAPPARSGRTVMEVRQDLVQSTVALRSAHAGPRGREAPAAPLTKGTGSKD
jgi:AAA family ATP:ADP antiporter